MNERIFNNIDLSISGGYNYINDKFKNTIIKNVNLIEFENLYANIIIQFHEYGINFTEAVGINDIFKLKELLKNKELYYKTEKWEEWKLFVNTFYKKIDIFSYATNSDLHNLIVQYAYQIMKELSENNKSIIYIDTDCIYYKGNINLLDINLKYKVKKINYFLFSGKKRYISFDGEIKLKGFRTSKDSEKSITIENTLYSPNDIFSKMKYLYRFDLIREILSD